MNKCDTCKYYFDDFMEDKFGLGPCCMIGLSTWGVIQDDNECGHWSEN